ncbi:MAG: hypothetical protein JO254_17365, partial [Pseudolabrys sp.]|nr:hypothetical protein [Pseudolabrys sp.]
VPARDWRAVWALVIIGCICGFCGTALFAGAVIDGLIAEYPATLAGTALLLAAAAIFYWSSRGLLMNLPPKAGAGAV